MSKPRVVEVTNDPKFPVGVAGGAQTKEQLEAVIEKWKEQNPTQVTPEKLAHLQAQLDNLPSEKDASVGAVAPKAPAAPKAASKPKTAAKVAAPAAPAADAPKE